MASTSQLRLEMNMGNLQSYRGFVDTCPRATSLPE